MQDNQLTRLSHYINTGFPCDKKNLLTDLHEFWPHREALSVQSGLITCGNRIKVPTEMRPEMLQYICRATRMEEGPKVTLDIQCLWRGGRVALTLTNNYFLHQRGSGGAWAITV